MCGSHILHDAFPLNDTTRLFISEIFIYLFIYFLKDLESPLIFVLIFRENKIRKKNPKCDS